MTAARAVAFDFNGTLSDDEPVLYAVYKELFAAQGRPISREQYFEHLAGLSEEAIIRGWLGVEGEALAELIEERIRRYRAIAADGSTVPEHVRAAVRFAAERVPLALVSGAFRAEIEPVLSAAGLLSSFRVLVTADDVEEGKPSPEGYAEALRRIDDDLEPGDVLGIEDTEAGVASAKAAGLYCVAVLGTHSRERLAAADEIADELDVELIRRLLR